MENNNQDQLRKAFQSAFENFEVPYTQDDILDMERRLKKNSFKFFFSWRFILSGIALLVVLGTMYFNYTSFQTQEEKVSATLYLQKESLPSTNENNLSSTTPSGASYQPEPIVASVASTSANRNSMVEKTTIQSSVILTREKDKSVAGQNSASSNHQGSSKVRTNNGVIGNPVNLLKNHSADKRVPFTSTVPQNIHPEITAGIPSANHARSVESTGVSATIENPKEEGQLSPLTVSNEVIPQVRDCTSLSTNENVATATITAPVHGHSPDALHPLVILNGFRSNPAYVGVSGRPVAYLGCSTPDPYEFNNNNTWKASLEKGFGKNNGSGVYYSRHLVGLSATSTLNMAYSHQLNVGENKNISLGAGAAWINKKIFWNEFKFGDMDNGVTAEKKTSGLSHSFECNLGALYNSRHVIAGISAIQPFQLVQNGRSPLQYEGMGAFVLYLNPRLNIAPAIKVKNSYGLMDYSPLLMVNYNNSYMLNISYQHLNSLVAGAGVKANRFWFLLSGGMYVDKELTLLNQGPFLEVGVRYQSDLKINRK